MSTTPIFEDKNQTAEEITTLQKTFVGTFCIVLGITVIIWTIFANTAIILCFFISRRKIWPSFSTQILSLSVSDLFVGYASLPLCLLAAIDVKVSTGACAALFYLFFVPQCASMYHIFAICIHRCVVIHKSARLNENQSNSRIPLISVVSAWIVSLVVCSFPHILCAEPKVIITYCMFDTLYKVNIVTARRLLFIAYVVPQVLTNILYAVACIRLHCIWRKVFPEQPVGLENTTGNLPHERETNEQNLPSNRSYMNRTGMRMQKRVMGTISVMMAIFNICTLPLLLIFNVESQEQETKRILRFMACTLFVLNSALNPFVYAMKTEWLKLALRKMVKDFTETICHSIQ